MPHIFSLICYNAVPAGKMRASFYAFSASSSLPCTVANRYAQWPSSSHSHCCSSKKSRSKDEVLPLTHRLGHWLTQCLLLFQRWGGGRNNVKAKNNCVHQHAKLLRLFFFPITSECTVSGIIWTWKTWAPTYWPFRRHMHCKTVSRNQNSFVAVSKNGYQRKYNPTYKYLVTEMIQDLLCSQLVPVVFLCQLFFFPVLWLPSSSS